MALINMPLRNAVGNYFVLLVLNPDQNSPTFMGWSGTKDDVLAAADELIAKNPRWRAVILETVETVEATTTLKSTDTKTGEERKRPQQKATELRT